MSEPAVDLPVLHTPPDSAEMADYLQFAKLRRQETAHLRKGHPLAHWHALSEYALSVLQAGLAKGFAPDEAWLLEARKAAALALAKGFAQYEEALKLAPEIGAEIEELRRAVNRIDSVWCSCHPSFATNAERIWSAREQSVVALWVCACCGFMNTRG